MQKISFVAHSLGGLVARYAVGRLYAPVSDREVMVVTGNCSSKENLSYATQCLEKHQESRVAGLEPMNFITFASPHLGSWGHKQVGDFFCSFKKELLSCRIKNAIILYVICQLNTVMFCMPHTLFLHN